MQFIFRNAITKDKGNVEALGMYVFLVGLPLLAQLWGAASIDATFSEHSHPQARQLHNYHWYSNLYRNIIKYIWIAEKMVTSNSVYFFSVL